MFVVFYCVLHASVVPAGSSVSAVCLFYSEKAFIKSESLILKMLFTH